MRRGCLVSWFGQPFVGPGGTIVKTIARKTKKHRLGQFLPEVELQQGATIGRTVFIEFTAAVLRLRFCDSISGYVASPVTVKHPSAIISPMLH